MIHREDINAMNSLIYEHVSVDFKNRKKDGIYFLEAEEYNYYKPLPINRFSSFINSEKVVYTFSIADGSVSHYRGVRFIRLIIRGLLSYHFPKYYYKIPGSWRRRFLDDLSYHDIVKNIK